MPTAGVSSVDWLPVRRALLGLLVCMWCSGCGETDQVCLPHRVCSNGVAVPALYVYRETELASLMQAWGVQLDHVDNYRLSRNGAGTALLLQPFSPEDNSSYEISAAGVRVLPRVGLWMLTSDAGEIVAWRVKTPQGVVIHFATGDRRPLELHESVECDWSGRFCALQRPARLEHSAHTQIFRTDRPNTPLLSLASYGLSLFSKDELLYVCSPSPDREVRCEILDLQGRAYRRVARVRVPQTDRAEDLDPWSDSLLLNERISDHPPRNRWVVIDVRSGQIRDLGRATRWAFFLSDDLIGRALERAQMRTP